MRMKRTMLLIFFLLSGIIIGALVASACANVGFLSWLSFSRSVGISPSAPFVLDLSAFQFSFGFSIELSVAQIIFIGLAIFLYARVAKKL